MPILEKIWINSVKTRGIDRNDLRLDWSNDRHQAVDLKAMTPDDVKQGLLDAARLIAAEQANERL